MKAAIFRGGDIVVDTLPIPVPGQNQALVKVLCCGICGSDLHAAKHARRMVEVTKRIPGRIPMELDKDVVFGHEFCCEVIDYGPKTEKRLKPGTRVCAMPVILEADGPKGMGYSNTAERAMPTTRSSPVARIQAARPAMIWAVLKTDGSRGDAVVPAGNEPSPCCTPSRKPMQRSARVTKDASPVAAARVRNVGTM